MVDTRIKINMQMGLKEMRNVKRRTEAIKI